MSYDLTGKRVFVAGHRGLVGSALVRRLAGENCAVVTADRSLDLREQAPLRQWFAAHKPDAVILAAAKAGGILAHESWPAQFIYDNLMIEANVIEAARRVGVGKLLLLGSSAVYPKMADQPIVEEALLSGPLDSGHEPYSIAKIAGIKLCQAYRREYGCDFISVLPTNLYGPGDSFDAHSSHVVPALIRKVHEAKTSGASFVEIWGTGTPRRELLHVDDCADACVFLLKRYSGASHINLGSGEDITILELAEMVRHAVGFEGQIVTNPSKPDGTPRKLMAADKLQALGWKPSIPLDEGIAQTYRWFLDNLPD